MIRKFFIALALGLVHLGPWAQGMPPQAPASGLSARPVAFLLGMGLTNGGDTVVTAVFTNGTTTAITAGARYFFKVGADWRISSNFSAQGTIGYHGNTVKGADGELSFDRAFIEGLGFWHYLPRHRIGLGARQTSGTKLRGSGVASSLGTIEFSSSLGTVLEYEWMIARNSTSGYGITLRYVTEKYTATSDNGMPITGPEFNGNHMGIGLHLYF